MTLFDQEAAKTDKTNKHLVGHHLLSSYLLGLTVAPFDCLLTHEKHRSFKSPSREIVHVTQLFLIVQWNSPAITLYGTNTHAPYINNGEVANYNCLAVNLVNLL